MWHLIISLFLEVMIKTREKKMIGPWRFELGEVRKQHGAGHRDRRFPVGREIVALTSIRRAVAGISI